MQHYPDTAHVWFFLCERIWAWDTVCMLHAQSKWRIAVPSGMYSWYMVSEKSMRTQNATMCMLSHTFYLHISFEHTNVHRHVHKWRPRHQYQLWCQLQNAACAFLCRIVADSYSTSLYLLNFNREVYKENCKKIRKLTHRTLPADPECEVLIGFLSHD